MPHSVFFHGTPWTLKSQHSRELTWNFTIKRLDLLRHFVAIVYSLSYIFSVCVFVCQTPAVFSGKKNHSEVLRKLNKTK